jgi:hypothetical protein
LGHDTPFLFITYSEVLLDLIHIGVIQVQHDALASTASSQVTFVIHNNGEVSVDEIVGKEVAAATAEVIVGAIVGHEVVGANNHAIGCGVMK